MNRWTACVILATRAALFGVLRAGRPALLTLIVGLFVFRAPAPATGCTTENDNSVHFNTSQPDFGSPPTRLHKDLTEHGDQYLLWKKLEMHAQMEARARAAEQAMQWQTAEAFYAKAMTFVASGNDRDRMEVLRRVRADAALARSPGFSQALQLYLAGMAQIDSDPTRANARFVQVYSAPSAGFLREHALYQQASEAYHMFDYSGSIALYRRLLNEFPATAKREEALMMIVRAALLPETNEGRNVPVGQQALTESAHRFPHSRFRRALAGLQARILFLNGQWNAAADRYLSISDLDSVEMVLKQMSDRDRAAVSIRLLAAYLRRLPHTSTFRERDETLAFIRKIWLGFSKTQEARFETLLLRDPVAADSYLYYRLFASEPNAHELGVLTAFAEKLASAQPSGQVSAPVLSRVADLYYHRRAYSRALWWANRACRAKRFDGALYVRGATLEKLRQVHRAIVDFRTLLAHCPDSPLRRGARAELAILYEKAGDLTASLDQYFMLGYPMDVAFLLDARMSVPQVEACLNSPVGRSGHRITMSYWWEQTNSPRVVTASQHDLILYSLGVRYLRAGRWQEAIHALRRVPSHLFYEFGRGRREWASRPSPDPITAAQQLGALQAAAVGAHGSAARARAWFRYGLYYSQHGTLLLYNAALWQHEREVGIDLEWNGKHADKGDLSALRDHMYQHEVYARSRAILLRVARRYPRSEVAPAALYFAGYAARYLARFNSWWDREESNQGFWHESAHRMRQLIQRYPRSPFAKRARLYLAGFS